MELRSMGEEVLAHLLESVQALPLLLLLHM